ncbi:MAG: cytochrome P450 [Gaiellaceae bacterium MAG52_C11]|nr:cytochrome P450 [Candidatus Gaiellasilicea maunaloa]
MNEERVASFPIGAAVTIAELERDPHPLLARLREREPVSWLPALDGWLVTRRDLTLEVMRDAETYTVDDPRFSTGQVVGASMLSLDGSEHTRHRDPFARPFRLDAVRERFADFVETEVERLLAAIEPRGESELRRSLAGPLSVAAMMQALGLVEADTSEVLGWYDSIVAGVTSITAGQPAEPAAAEAFERLRVSVERAFGRDPDSSLVAAAAAGGDGLSGGEVVSNAAVLLFGGIETTEGMIANAILHVLESPEQRALLERDPALVGAAVEESLRLEPAAAVVDRYATRAVELGGARIGERELVTVSLAGANRDPAVFAEPDRFDVSRENARLHVTFAQGPHVCIGMHLARLEAQVALGRILARLSGVRLDPERPSAARGLVFRKPPTLWARWDALG